MRSSLPSSAMDCSPDSSCNPSINFHSKFSHIHSMQHTSMPNIYKLLPNFPTLEPAVAIKHLPKSKTFTSQLFPLTQPTFLHSTNTVSNFLNSLTADGSPGTADKEHPWLRFGRELGQRINGGKICLRNAISNAVRPRQQRVVPCFASVSVGGQELPVEAKNVFQLALSTKEVAARLCDVPVYTVSNYNNEFVLVSDPNSLKSLGLLCFRKEDAEALLAQVRLKQPGISRGAKIVSLSLEKVYTLKVEGIAFRFVPNPIQVRNALEIKSRDLAKAFDGVPVFQSDLVVLKKKNRSLTPLYFCKEDLDRDLEKIMENSPRSLSSSILVGSLEGALKAMEESKKDSEWENLIFIPPGKSYVEYIKRIVV